MAFLEIEQLQFSYHGRLILAELDFVVKRGDFVALVGPNGCGKTTLLHNISAVLHPDSGQVLLDGQAVHDLSARQLGQQLACVSQSEDISFDFTVQEVVSLGRLPHLGLWQHENQLDERIVEQALERTHTLDLRNRFVTQLSGGERQRVLIARALAQQPQLLLLDEPTSHLDIQHQLELMSILEELHQEGMTIITALHDLDLARSYAQKALLLSAGRIIAYGAPQQVLEPELISRVYGVQMRVVEEHLIPIARV